MIYGFGGIGFGFPFFGGRGGCCSPRYGYSGFGHRGYGFRGFGHPFYGGYGRGGCCRRYW